MSASDWIPMFCETLLSMMGFHFRDPIFGIAGYRSGDESMMVDYRFGDVGLAFAMRVHRIASELCDMGQQDVDRCRTALMSYLGNIRHPNYESSDLLLPKTEIIYNLAGEVYPTHQAWRESNFAEWENGRPHRTPWKREAIKCGDPALDAETLAFWENDTWALDLLRNACDTSWSRLSLNAPENLVEMDTHPEFGLTVRTPMTHLIAVHEQVMEGMELVQKTAFGDSRFLEVRHRIYPLPVSKGGEFYDYNEKHLDGMRTIAI